MADLERALGNTTRPAAEVLAVDWKTASEDNGVSQLDGKRWIKAVAAFAVDQVHRLGYFGTNLNVAGHSWGAYVCQEIAFEILQASGLRVNKLIALDPALVGAGSTTEGQGLEQLLGGVPSYFSDVAVSAWAFYGSPLGSLLNTETADDSFVLLNPFFPFVGSLEHRFVNLSSVNQDLALYDAALLGLPNATAAHVAAAEAFAKMLLDNENNTGNNIAQQFALTHTWLPNQVQCYLGGVVVVRTKRLSSSIFDTDFPLDAVVKIDAAYEAQRLWPPLR
jgi:pimeloyl-ACP methyl ester carboxylesterase